MTSHKVIALLAVLGTLQGFSQRVRDAGLWVSGSFRADVGKKLEAYVDPEIRWDENITRVRGFFSDIGISRELSDIFSVEAELRIGGRRVETWYEGRHRLSVGLGARTRTGDFGWAILARHQVTPTVYGAENDVDIRGTSRIRGSVKYSGLRRTDLQASFELFSGKWSEGWSNWRAQASVERKINKRNFWTVGYLVQKDLSNLDMDFVFRVGYVRKWDLDRKRDRNPAPAQS